MREEAYRIVRFGISGLTATAVHYSILVLLVEEAEMTPIALANGLATPCAMVVSYLGNRYFVMRSTVSHGGASLRFLACYACVIGIHSGAMALWADWAGLNYSVGFVLFTGIAAAVTYLLNGFYVFRNRGEESPSRTTGSGGR